MTKNHHLIAVGRVMIPAEAYRDEIAVYISHDTAKGPDRISCPGHRKEAGQIEHTQYDPRHFSIALALAEYVAGLRRV